MHEVVSVPVQSGTVGMLHCNEHVAALVFLHPEGGHAGWRSRAKTFMHAVCQTDPTDRIYYLHVPSKFQRLYAPA